MRIRLVDRYIGRVALLGIAAVWVVMTALYVVFSLLSELRNGHADYGASDALWFVLLTIPRMAYQVFPVSALLGALVGVGGLAAANELVAFRTSGVSRSRLAVAALTGTLVLTAPVMIVGEWVAPAAEQQARAFRLSEMTGQAIIGGPRGMWMRDGSDIVNIQLPILSADRGQQSVEFKKVVIYRFDEVEGLTSIIRAENAIHDEERWTLEKIRDVDFADDSATARFTERRAWSTEVRPGLLDSAVSRPDLLSLRALRDYLAYLGENGLDDRVYRVAFWEKVLFPFTVVALVLAGMPFVFAQVRSQSVGVRLFVGMTVGGVFMIVNRAIQKMSSVYEFSPLLSMSIPILLLGLGAVIVLRRSV
ncbi:MAG: LPS export ABC transporter permease LptG [Xanthomonadales bacterium]